MSAGIEATEYLDATDHLLRTKVPGTIGLWPRACAWLMRLALETAMRDLWGREHPAVASTNMRAQLLSLNRVFDEGTAAWAEHLWASLSRAGHHHPYELSPTAAELRGWYQDVNALMLIFARPRGAGRPSAG